jgi:hypothetical protein
MVAGFLFLKKTGRHEVVPVLAIAGPSGGARGGWRAERAARVAAGAPSGRSRRLTRPERVVFGGVVGRVVWPPLVLENLIGRFGSVKRGISGFSLRSGATVADRRVVWTARQAHQPVANRTGKPLNPSNPQRILSIGVA